MKQASRHIIQSISQMLELVLDFRFNPRYKARQEGKPFSPRFGRASCSVRCEGSFKIADRIPLEWRRDENRLLILEIYVISKKNGKSFLVEQWYPRKLLFIPF